MTNSGVVLKESSRGNFHFHNVLRDIPFSAENKTNVFQV
jgi:hypothetical protein